jgi:phosphatidylglycerol:prolipoprotein diacylglycerol transferase
MFPTIDIGSIHLSTYGAMYGLAVVVGGMLAFHRLIQGGIPTHHATRGVLLVIWIGLAGAFLGRGLVYLLQTFILTGTITWVGGSAFMGALIVGSIVALLYCRREGLSLGRSLDLGGVAIPLAQAIGRLGCLAAGCCYGKPTDSWLGMYMPDTRGTWMTRYPTQLMSSAANLLIFFFLLGFEHYRIRRLGRPEDWPFDGFLFLLYVELYCLKRFSVEFLRHSHPVIGPFTLAHIACLVIFVISTALMLRGLRSTAPSLQRYPITKQYKTRGF